MDRWTEADIPDQRGRVAVVTGANSGIGLATARALAAKGATVVFACRDGERAADAARTVPGAEVLTLDLGDLQSVREAAAELRQRRPRVDLLVNNAGVTGVGGRSRDGHEIQFAVNHLGHFAFTGLILDRLVAAPAARIVTVSSIAHRFGKVDDLEALRGAYGRSKLANLLFTYALQRRLAASGARAIAVAAHPGGAPTAIFRHSGVLGRAFMKGFAAAFGRTSERAALPSLRAATGAGVQGGQYYGPDGLMEIAGYAGLVASSRGSHDRAAQESLWERSVAMSGVDFGALDVAASSGP